MIRQPAEGNFGYLEEVPLLCVVDSVHFTPTLVEIFVVLHVTVKQESFCYALSEEAVQ